MFLNAGHRIYPRYGKEGNETPPASSHRFTSYTAFRDKEKKVICKIPSQPALNRAPFFYFIFFIIVSSKKGMKDDCEKKDKSVRNTSLSSTT